MKDGASVERHYSIQYTSPPYAKQWLVCGLRRPIGRHFLTCSPQRMLLVVAVAQQLEGARHAAEAADALPAARSMQLTPSRRKPITKSSGTSFQRTVAHCLLSTNMLYSAYAARSVSMKPLCRRFSKIARLCIAIIMHT